MDATDGGDVVLLLMLLLRLLGSQGSNAHPHPRVRPCMRKFWMISYGDIEIAVSCQAAVTGVKVASTM